MIKSKKNEKQKSKFPDSGRSSDWSQSCAICRQRFCLAFYPPIIFIPAPMCRHCHLCLYRCWDWFIVANQSALIIVFWRPLSPFQLKCQKLIPNYIAFLGKALSAGTHKWVYEAFCKNHTIRMHNKKDLILLQSIT